MGNSTRTNQTSFYVQTLKVMWDKTARGGVLAQKRGALPCHFERQVEALQTPQAIFESWTWSVEDEFQSPRETRYARDLTSDFNHDEFFFDGLNGFLQLDCTQLGAPHFRCDWSFDYPGSPKQSHRFQVPPTGWGQARWNGRFSGFYDDSTWNYEQTTINLAAFSGAQRLFVGEPILLFSRMAILR